MKTLGIVIGIILILALVCSPVLAISKSDLISQYRTDLVVAPPPPKEKFSTTYSILELHPSPLSGGLPSLMNAWKDSGGLGYIFDPSECGCCGRITYQYS
jgi:hypothetical protein